MDAAKREERMKQLVEALASAGSGSTDGNTAASHAQKYGLFGGLDKQLWAAVATRILNMIEEIAREQIDAWIIKHGGATGGLYAVDPNAVPPKE